MRTINNSKFRHSLNCLCNCLNNLYDINNGGCCYVAYLIAYHLDKLNIRYNLVIYDYIKKDERKIEYEILNRHIPNSITGINTCDHYCISISGDIINKSDSSYLEKHVIKNVTNKNIKWIYKKGNWNKMYDRNNDKFVRRMINLFFSKYEQSDF